MAVPGRIYFPGNPWPRGHGLEELRWSGRLHPERGLFFDLHLQSEDYYAEREGDEPESESSWTSPLVWGNYHRCHLSSVKWGPDEGVHVGDQADPFDFSALAEREWHIDMEGFPDADDQAFHIYLLGHDTVLRHRIRFHEPRGRTFALHWHAQIALTYAGDTNLDHSLEVKAPSVTFDGFRVLGDLSAYEAREHLDRFTTGPTGYALRDDVFLPMT